MCKQARVGRVVCDRKLYKLAAPFGYFQARLRHYIISICRQTLSIYFRELLALGFSYLSYSPRTHTHLCILHACLPYICVCLGKQRKYKQGLYKQYVCVKLISTARGGREGKANTAKAEIASPPPHPFAIHNGWQMPIKLIKNHLFER